MMKAARVRLSALLLVRSTNTTSRILPADGLFSSAFSLQPHATTKKRRWISTLGKFVLRGTVIGGAGWIALSDSPSRTAKLVYAVPVRVARDVATAAAIAADYSYSLYDLQEGSAEREAAKHEAHLRCANRLQALCFKNGGIYIKLGQHIGQLDYLVPQEYVQTMRNSMLDKCPVSSYKQVCDVFLEELGRLPQQVFAEFDPVPLASASLAQVHVARTRDGQKVAVKELDFLNEAKNSEECIRNFAKMSPEMAPQIVVPKVVYNLSTSKLLVMEFMEGVGVTDVTSIKKLGLRPADVAHLISQVFAEMIFRHGFVHCDPHAANMMIRAAPYCRWNIFGWWKKPQLILLDHGLYKTIDLELRTNYAGLWKALVFADVPRIKEYGIRLGAGDDLYVLFAGVLTMRPWDHIVVGTIDHLNVPDSVEGRAEIQKYAAQYLVEVSELLRRLPRVVLLLLKTNDCLRAVDKALVCYFWHGGNGFHYMGIRSKGAPVNTYVIVARESSRALAEIPRAKGFTLLSYCVFLFESFKVELRLWILQIMAWIGSVKPIA